MMPVKKRTKTNNAEESGIVVIVRGGETEGERVGGVELAKTCSTPPAGDACFFFALPGSFLCGWG